MNIRFELLIGRQLLAMMVLAAAMVSTSACAGPPSGILDPSFEQPQEPDQFGHVFKHWQGWKYEGDCEFRVSTVAHSGKYSCLIYGSNEPKIRMFLTQAIAESGRYKITAYIRGLDIGLGNWDQTTEFAFDEKYIPLNKSGTFGWTKLTYVTDVEKKREVLGPSFGLMAPGYLWIDDVTMVKVGDEVPLTKTPILGKEESPILPQQSITDNAVRCPECSYRNPRNGKVCYACGTNLKSTQVAAQGPDEKTLDSFESSSSFDNGKIDQRHATQGKNAWRLDKGYTDWHGNQDWTGYDYLKVDLHTDAKVAMDLNVEIRDKKTQDYWTRFNYFTAIPPGSSTLIIPTDVLYVGEKSRPGRKLLLSDVTRLVFNIGDEPLAPLYIDNVRLERDSQTRKMQFDGLHAFDLGTGSSPLMPGFTKLSPAIQYTKGRGFGLKNASIWRAFDVLQPEPLYQDFICFERGGIAIDVPNGRYHVFVNLDNPSGYWGEYQHYRKRDVIVERRLVSQDVMNVQSLRKKYFRNFDAEDLPDQNAFDKYQQPYFAEKEFDVDVSDGQLNLEFSGQDWACSVSAVIVYPIAEKERGESYLNYVREQRRFFYDNYFKRILHIAEGNKPNPTNTERENGFVVFSRDYMEDVYYNDTPRRGEAKSSVKGFAFTGEYEPLTVSVYPLRDLGDVRVSISDLKGPSDAMLSATNIDIGYVSYRISRETMEGTVYTIKPRTIIPRNSVNVSEGATRRFWLTVRVPSDTLPGTYQGTISVASEKGQTATVPVSFRVFKGTLDDVDIPVGPWGHNIEIPWDENDSSARSWNTEMTRKGLSKLREYGFTSFSGMPVVEYQGFQDGRPQFDFSKADAQMRMARDAGFEMPVVNYCDFGGLNLYERDEAAMQNAGFSDYSEFVKAIFTAIQEHADRHNWLPVYWNLGDEPIGKDDLAAAAGNAMNYRKAFPTGPPLFTVATSFDSASKRDGHFDFSSSVHVANLNLHNAKSVKLLQSSKTDWAFYNGGNRWTYGTYMYKAAKEYGMKFRLAWHWNNVAGDPYYPLDCREDDYAWCNASPDGELIPSVRFEREMREGLDDYRYMLTLENLAAKKKSREAQSIIKSRLASFELGQRDHDELFDVADWRTYRRQMAEAIERLRQ